MDLCRAGQRTRPAGCAPKISPRRDFRVADSDERLDMRIYTQ